MLHLNTQDFSWLELLRVRLQNLASHPSTPSVGWIYYNTVDNTVYICTNATGPVWSDVLSGSGSPDADATTKGILKLTNDLGGTASLPTVANVGGASAANVADAVTKRHTQNTDTGTTQTSFNIDSGGTGVKVKNNAGTAEFKNLADNAFSDIKANTATLLGDLNITGGINFAGTAQVINTTTLEIGDNILVLNDDETGTPSANAGIEVERGTSTNSTLLWDETSDTWGGGLVGSVIKFARVYSTTIGTGSATDIDVTHNLGTRSVITEVYSSTTPYAKVECDIEHKDTNTVTAKFAVAPTSGQYTIVVTG